MEEATERAIELCAALTRALHEHSDDAWKDIDLTLPQLRCLFVVARGEPISIGGVAAQLGVQLSTASALLDRLVEQGLVGRREDREDRRRTLASTTEAGASLVSRLRQGSLETLRTWLDALPPADLEALVRGLEALARVGNIGCSVAPAGAPASASHLEGPA